MQQKTIDFVDDTYRLIQEGDPRQAIKRCETFLKEHDALECAQVYNLLGQSYIGVSDYPQAITYLHKGIQIAETINDQTTIAKLYMVLSVAYMHMEDQEGALSIQLKALSIAKDQSDELVLINCYSNLGGIYCSMKRYDEALEALENVVDWPLREGRDRVNYTICAANNNMGEVYFHKKGYVDAIRCYEKALAVAEKIQGVGYITTVYFNLADIHKQIGEYVKALEYAEISLEKVLELEDKFKEAEAYKQISEIYELMEDFKNGLIFFKCHKDIKESVVNIEATRKVEKLEREYLERERQKEKDQTLKLSKLNQELIETNEKLVQANEEIKYVANQDFLTETLNRRGFNVAMDEMRRTCRESKQTYTLMMIDIDNFKRINDTYGHTIGDSILKHCGKVLKEVVGDKGIVGRFGGEEFIIASMDNEDQDVIALAEAIRQSIQENYYNNTRHKKISYTVTIGISTLHTLDEEVHLKQADKCLYKGKQGTKNCVVYQ